MSNNLQEVVREVGTRCGNDPTRMMDVVREVQARLGCVSDEAVDLIAQTLKVPRIMVEGVVTFYAFYSRQQQGRTVIRVCSGCQGLTNMETAKALEAELGIKFGQTTPDGAITLEATSCLGLCDQGPGAMVNEVLVTRLTADKAKAMVRTLKDTGDPKKLVTTTGGGRNASPAVHAMVENHIRRRDKVLLAPVELGAGLRRALSLTPDEVIQAVKEARLKGRGGAGFLTGMKWDFARKSAGDRKFLVCNADEGEPGTFKDRVILTEMPEMLFEGMAIGGYAIGAREGILYLRGEYAYLQAHLEEVLGEMRSRHLLGRDLLGKGVDFDIRIQMGAGAYVCGEESALLSSCVGKRGVPRNRPPFPVEKGYLDLPTSVNNVETLCCATRIMEKGSEWFAAIGTRESAGTKLLSVSGDCEHPGVYELPFGVSVKELLELVGGEKAQAVLVGGPSGSFVPPSAFGRKLGFEDLPTGGSVMVFGPQRDLLRVVTGFMHFFVEESCGFCAPCRVGNVLLHARMERILAGKGQAEDLRYLEELCVTVKKMSRCGLGQTSPNPVQSTLANFRPLYEARLAKNVPAGLQPGFDLDAALVAATQAQGRAPVFHDD